MYSRKLLQQQIEETAVQVEAVQIAATHQVAAVQVELVLHREHLLHQVEAEDLVIRVRQPISVVSLVDGHHRVVSEVQTIKDVTMQQVQEARFMRQQAVQLQL